MNISDVPYLSPVMHYDAEARTMVLQHRDAKTGEVSFQVPSQEEVKRSRLARLTEATPEDASSSGSPTHTVPSSESSAASHGGTAGAATAAPDTGSEGSTSPLRVSVLV